MSHLKYFRLRMNNSPTSPSVSGQVSLMPFSPSNFPRLHKLRLNLKKTNARKPASAKPTRKPGSPFSSNTSLETEASQI